MEQLSVYKEVLAHRLKPSRYKHSISVMTLCERLSVHYGADVEKAIIAGLLHDYGKCIADDELIAITEQYDLEVDDYMIKNYHVLHALVGAHLVQRELGIDDEEILNAIRYHTIGNEKMSTVEKIVFLADYIEPGRNYPGVDLIRKEAFVNLDSAMIMAIQSSKSYLESQNREIHPKTLELLKELLT